MCVVGVSVCVLRISVVCVHVCMYVLNWFESYRLSMERKVLGADPALKVEKVTLSLEKGHIVEEIAK